MTTQIKFVGSGGQGIVLLGFILSRAAVVYEEKNATNIQSYGSRVRGGSTVSDVIISDSEIVCPIITNPDILVIMSEESLEEFVSNLKKGGLLLIDESIKTFSEKNFRIFRIPAIKIAESEFKSKTPANLIMLGALIGITDIVSEESILNALLDVMLELDLRESVKERNIQALIRGVKLGRELAKKNSGG